MTNPAFLLGSLLLIGFLGLAVFGDRLTHGSAYETHGALMIDGVIGALPSALRAPFRGERMPSGEICRASYYPAPGAHWRWPSSQRSHAS